MNAITNFLTGEWAYAFGWALFHSLWQSLLIFFIVRTGLRSLPAHRSGLRYAVASGGLLLLVISSVLTFVYLVNQPPALSADLIPMSKTTVRFDAAAEQSVVSRAFTNIAAAIQDHMPLMLLLWATGFLFFASRLAGGLMYTAKLKSGGRLVLNEWNDFIGRAAQKLGINRLVTLVQSESITTPMVIGYLKPVILIPARMLTGLSTEQLETVFLHELAHIRRHDYLVNLLQSIVETVFFFNPIAWSLSKLIRREREYCCDDLVIRHHGSARAYAHALVQLAEIEHFSPRIVIALAGEQNQLLNRIRRIMEKSVKNYSGGNRMLAPAFLLVSGLLCISWLGIQQNESPASNAALAEPDTVIREKENIGDNENTAWYSRKSIITIDENGQPHEEVIEQFEGDEDLRPLLKKQFPSAQGSSSLKPPHMLFQNPVLPYLPATVDTIPPGFDTEQWDDFAKAFENFSMDFDEHFSFHGEDLSKFMEDLEERFRLNEWSDSARFNFKIPKEALKNLEKLQDDEWFGALEEQLKRLEELDFEHLRRLQREFDIDSIRHRGGLQHSLRDELIEDGYLSENESIQSLEWSDEVFKVNGKELKEGDVEKYRQLFHRYSNGRPLERLE